MRQDARQNKDMREADRYRATAIFCAAQSSTGNRYANVFLHPGLQYGFGGAVAQVPSDVDRRLQARAA
jgi:hypothetical protein